MVDPLSTSGRARLLKVETDTPQVNKTAQASGTKPAAAADEVSLSKAAGRLPAGLDSGPPFDMDTVQRIKTAISEGNYPVNHERIADSLFDSYRELVS